jgi:FdhE protein
VNVLASSAGSVRERLAQAYPEWAPYLGLLGEVEREIDAPAWETITLGERADTAGGPLLSGRRIEIDAAHADRWCRRLVTGSASLDAVALIEATIEHDEAGLAALAQHLHLERSMLNAVASLVAMPLLHACRRRLEPLPVPTFACAGCPVCGSWPALAEARGLEGERRLRCGRCGADWRTEWLTCCFCGNDDHVTLGSLVSEGTPERRHVETCERCRGYVKTLTTLVPVPAVEVMYEDCATIDLDLVARARGYLRPDGTGMPLAVELAPRARVAGRLRDFFGRTRRSTA